MLQFTDTVTLTKLVRERCIRRVLTLYTSWRKENADLRHGPLKGTDFSIT